MKVVRHLVLLTAMFAAGCGGDEPAAVRTQPASVTPVPTSDAPVPSPTAGIHASPTPTPTPTASPDTGGAQAGQPETGGAGAGDEEGIQVPVMVTVSLGRIVVTPPVVPAFLPFLITARNTLDGPVTVVLMLEGGEAGRRFQLGPRQSMSRRFAGLRAQKVEIISPQLGPRASTQLRVRR